MNGFGFFDPFYDIAIVGTVFPLDDDQNNDGIPDLFPWQSANNASPQNPLGIRGTWLNYDANIPSQTIDGYADAININDASTVALNQGRAMHTLTRIAGADGIEGTIDDRILVLGGSDNYFPFYGDSASSVSCEVFVPPDAGM